MSSSRLLLGGTYPHCQAMTSSLMSSSRLLLGGTYPPCYDELIDEFLRVVTRRYIPPHSQAMFTWTRVQVRCSGILLAYFLREAFTRFCFTGDCQQTRVELCAYTSDCECSTCAGEACTSDRQPVNANPDSDSQLCLCEHSLTTPYPTL